MGRLCIKLWPRRCADVSSVLAEAPEVPSQMVAPAGGPSLLWPRDCVFALAETPVDPFSMVIPNSGSSLVEVLVMSSNMRRWSALEALEVAREPCCSERLSQNDH